MYNGIGPIWSNMVSSLLRLLTIIAALGLPTGSASESGAVRILALGDSLTAGFGLRPEEGFTAQLQAALQARDLKAVVLNAGVSGDTTAGGLARLEWALGDQPDMVILALGANDSLRGLNPDVTKANLEQILQRLQAKRLPVLLAGIYAPPNLGKAYTAQFNAIYPQLAERYRVLFYPFFLDGVAAKPELNQADGIHPNAEGVAIIVERITPYVLRLIGSLRNAGQ